MLVLVGGVQLDVVEDLGELRLAESQIFVIFEGGREHLFGEADEVDLVIAWSAVLQRSQFDE